MNNISGSSVAQVMGERIHVAVRAKPHRRRYTPSRANNKINLSEWRIEDNTISNSTHTFQFDRIFGGDIKTTEVYEARTKDIVKAAVHGFNGTVIAYGQTNSGKTHTMRGSTSEPGLIPLSIRDDMDREFQLKMSYMEIYNEEINDLLAPGHRKLQIHESTEGGIYVAGLREDNVTSPEQVFEIMEFGESHRHIGKTDMNFSSSRSHTIFRMIIQSTKRSENEVASSSCDALRMSVLLLVDLAGSERVAKTGAAGGRLKEGSHINKGLLSLGTVIERLSEGAGTQGGHVPYRDCKLTRILKPAVGGNSNTAIICNITLDPMHADETKSSLQFASRALRVTNCALVNEIVTDAALIKHQKKEIQELKAKLQDKQRECFNKREPLKEIKVNKLAESEMTNVEETNTSKDSEAVRVIRQLQEQVVNELKDDILQNTRFWTLEEERILEEAIAACSRGTGKNISWKEVMNYKKGFFQGRTREHLRDKWKRIRYNREIEALVRGFPTLLRDEKIEELSRLYILLSKKPRGFYPVSSMFKQHVIAEGMTLVKQAEDAASKKAEKKDVVGLQEQIFVTKVTELHDKYLAYVNGCFRNHTLFRKALKEAYEVFCYKGVAGNSRVEFLAVSRDNSLKLKRD